MKPVNLLLVAVAAVLVSAGTAFASINISGGNNTTGPCSENENNWSIENSNQIDIENCAEVDNDFDVCVNTGENDISKNTCVGDLWTGDIDGSVMFDNVLNNSDIVLAPFWDGDIDVVLANSLTGPGSENENNVCIRNENEINIRNNANIDNDIDFRANTGRNTVSKNTSVGNIMTGDISFSADVRNVANSSDWDLSDLLNNSSVSVSAGNNVTGPDSENENNVSIENSNSINITNTANIDNDVDVHANTGENYVGNNTVVGNIVTGSISIDYTSVNSAN